MVRRSGEVVNALHRRKIDFCSAQETRWKGGSARMVGAISRRYELFWQGCNKGTAGLVLVCLFPRDGLTVLSMWSESMSGSCILSWLGSSKYCLCLCSTSGFRW